MFQGAVWADVLDLLKYVIPALVVLGAVYLTIQQFLDGKLRMKQISDMDTAAKTAIPLRLQAYERLTLFLERIAPNNLLYRVNQSDMTSFELKVGMLNSIRDEYDHNVSQQIYVTPDLWKLITMAKEETIKNIILAGQQVPEDSPSKDLSKIILDAMMSSKAILPTTRAKNALHQEAQELIG